MIQKTKTLVMHKATNYALLFLIFTAALVYVYFANMAVRALTTLEKTKTQMQALSVEVSEMEAKSLAVENDFSIEKALSLGFVEMNNPIFIIKTPKKTSLSMKTD